MALLRCGGKTAPKETVLWTNNNPSTDPAGQSVTLAESLDNFDYIKFKWNASTSDTTNTGQAIDEVAHFKIANSRCPIGMVGGNQSSYNGVRELQYTNSTTIYIGSGHPVGSTGGFSITSIPTQIIGIKL